MSDNMTNNLFGDEIVDTTERNTQKARTKRETKKATASLSCRDKLLLEYKSNEFDVTKKSAKYDDGSGKYLPLSEKIRMFRSDFPDGNIECTILCDNNVFATVQAKVTCSAGSVTAVAKWYHNNQDVFGINYLGTAQSNAVSNALRLLGYDISTEIDAPPKANIAPDNMELMPLLPELTYDESRNSRITNGTIPNLKPRKNNELTFEQAKTVFINTPPFNGKTIGEILETEYKLDEFYKLLEFFASTPCALTPAAKVVLENRE